MPASICLIIPCFNEAARLDFNRLRDIPADVRCLFVDDGSTDGTADVIRVHQSDQVHLLQLSANVGKAEAIRRGFFHARAEGWLDTLEWVGYWDADLSTPLAELPNFLRYAALSGEPIDGIFGSRVYRLGSSIVRSRHRHVFGRLFTTISSTLLHLHCYDSQCGAKLFRPAVALKAFDEPFISRWIFDVEILARLRGCHLIEYPLREWSDVDGSKLNLIKAAGTTVIDLARIRRRYGSGRNHRQPSH